MMAKPAPSGMRLWGKQRRDRSPSAPTGSDDGVALITTLLLLSLMSVLGLTMVLSMSSDMLINGYYSNYRGSFYAADSGLSIAREQLLNHAVAAVSTTPVTYFANPPLATSTGATVLNSITTTYGGGFTALNAGQGANSWAGSFQIANTSTCTNSFGIAPSSPTVTSTNAQGATGYQYIFNYTLCATGRALASQQVMASETGSMTLNVTAQTSTTQSSGVSFAAFGAFVNNFPPCLGPLVPGTMTGPMFTNGAWQFMTGGAYIFTDPVSQSNAKADYWFGSNCIQSPTSSYKSGSQTISPQFQGGLNLGQPAVALPANPYSQKWAVLDGKGCGEGSNVCGNSTSPPPPAPTQAQMSALLNISGTAYPASGPLPSSGVYLPYSCVGTPTCTNTLNGGGIYVAGNASVRLSIGTDSASPPNPTQIYRITQGTTTTTITTNPSANGGLGTTTVSSGSTNLTLAGVPQNQTVSPSHPATMLYVDGKITGLTGPGQGQPAVQDGSQITITANGDVDITGDVIYKTEPVTSTQNQIVAGTSPACCNGDPVATLIPGHDNNQVLGIFTATGNIQLSSSYSNNNLQVDGSLAALSSACASSSCGFTVNGYINTFNNIGGQIQSNIFSANMSTENTYFDRRFVTRPGFAPPWFPSTTISQSDIINALAPLVTQTVQRRSWVTSPQ